MKGSEHRLSKAWYSKPVHLAMWVTAIAMMTVPGRARAQAYGSGGGVFSNFGSSGLNMVCQFINSPIVTLILAVALLTCFVVAAMNEGKDTLSKILKSLMWAFAIVMLPGVMNLIGFKFGTCT